jgi:hypothetical protein
MQEGLQQESSFGQEHFEQPSLQQPRFRQPPFQQIPLDRYSRLRRQGPDPFLDNCLLSYPNPYL